MANEIQKYLNNVIIFQGSRVPDYTKSSSRQPATCIYFWKLELASFFEGTVLLINVDFMKNIGA